MLYLYYWAVGESETRYIFVLPGNILKLFVKLFLSVIEEKAFVEKIAGFFQNKNFQRRNFKSFGISEPLMKLQASTID